MRALVIPICTAAILAFGVAGASAQQSPTKQSQPGTQADKKSDTMQNQSGVPKAMTQSQLRDSLEKAGFKNVTILDAAYLVQAQTSQGDSVMMTINPPSIAGATASQATTGSAATGSGTGTGGGSTTGSGSDQTKK